MKESVTFSSNEIFKKTVEEIKKHDPWSEDIQIKLFEEPAGYFRTIISLKSRKKNLVAQKNELSPIKSLIKAKDAILRQIEKIHRKKRRIIFKETLWVQA